MTNPSAPTRHANVAIFVPHAGCPHQCSFCDQRAISGGKGIPSPQQVQEACEKALASLRARRQNGASDWKAEIAFFGGSFTALPRHTMEGLLKAAYPYIKSGEFDGIRLSTRPDAVDREVLAFLAAYGVTAVELGAQSMDDAVLALNQRGHTAAHVEKAAACIRSTGLELGLQMMTGLYGSTDDIDRRTAHQLAALSPATMRIYPTLVIENTRLAALFRSGEYLPPSLEQGVSLGAELLHFFEEEQGIPVIRLGLHAGAEMQRCIVAGPWHPAFRELCEGELYYTKAMALLKRDKPAGGRAILGVSPGAASKMAGHGRCNIRRLRDEGYAVAIHPREDILPRQVAIL